MDSNGGFNKQFFNKEIRAKLKADPKAYIESLNNAQLEGVDYKVVESSKSVFYVVIPYVDGNMSTQDMQNMLGADVGTVSTVGSLGTLASAGTASTVGSTLACASSASTATTIASGGSVAAS